jgi:hypothetical protein
MELTKIVDSQTIGERVFLGLAMGISVSVVKRLIDQYPHFFQTDCQIELNKGGSQLRIPGKYWFIPYKYEGKLPA